nr:MAG TPA: hypothetical protein [Caudoviricetes sp.]
MTYDDFNKEIERSLLDAYFKFRSNLPMKDDATGLEYKKQFKTTQEIASELDDMGGVAISAINEYMLKHEYTIATQPDGTVAWAIWERVMPIT